MTKHTAAGVWVACLERTIRPVEARVPDPIDKDIDRLLAEDPDLLPQLQDFDRPYERGEVPLIAHEDVRRRLGLGPSETELGDCGSGGLRSP